MPSVAKESGREISDVDPAWIVGWCIIGYIVLPRESSANALSELGENVWTLAHDYAILVPFPPSP